MRGLTVAGLAAAALLCAGVGTPKPSDVRPSPPGPLAYRTTWIGNTFGGGPKWVQNAIEGLAVGPDGTVVCASTWDEAGREYGVYRDGDVVGMCDDTHGWGELGGSAVAVGKRYLFIAMVHGNEGGHVKGAAYPGKGLAWYCISRRTLTGAHAPFAGGRGRFGDQLVIHELPEDMPGQVRGLAADGAGRLYVSDPISARIRIYDQETMRETGGFTSLRTRQLALGPTGDLWAIHAPDPHAPVLELLKPDRDEREWRIVRYARDGAAIRTLWMPSGVEPTALAFDRRGRLYVADNGPAQQVRVYGNPTRSDRIAGSLGVRGGVYARPNPGSTGPDRLRGPTGVGCDDAGNVYVGCNTPAGGAVLRAFAPWEAGRRPTLRWELSDQVPVDGAGHVVETEPQVRRTHKDGAHLVFVEEDWKGKILVYRWRRTGGRP